MKPRSAKERKIAAAVKPRSQDSARAFRTDWNRDRERITVYARDTAAAVVLSGGRTRSFDTVEHAERYAAQFGGIVLLPADREGGVS